MDLKRKRTMDRDPPSESTKEPKLLSSLEVRSACGVCGVRACRYWGSAEAGVQRSYGFLTPALHLSPVFIVL